MECHLGLGQLPNRSLGKSKMKVLFTLKSLMYVNLLLKKALFVETLYFRVAFSENTKRVLNYRKVS